MKTRKATALLSLLILKSLCAKCSALPRLKAGLDLNQYDQRQRRLSDCTIKLDSSTEEYRGGTAVKGIFFTLSPGQDIELLSIEFAVNRNVPLSIETEVYFREGDYSGFSSNPAEWTRVSSSPAQLAPNNVTAIVPVKGFETGAMRATTVYSLYVTLNSDDTMLAKLAGQIGDPSVDDGILKRFVGPSITDGPFPDSLSGSRNAEFLGVIHYKTVQTCNSILQTTKFELGLAINAIPSDENLAEIGDSFEGALNAVFVTADTLATLQRQYMIEVNSTAANFAGRSDVCPTTFSECALVTASAQIQHLPSLTSGQLRRQLYESATALADLVISRSANSADLAYVGGSITGWNMAVEFQGVPGQMDGTQIQYFQLVFAEFLASEINGMDIHEVVVVSQNTNSRRNLRLGNADDRYRRELQSTVTSNIIVYATGGNETVLQQAVFEAVQIDNQQLIRSLQLEVLRPGFLVLEPDVIVEPLFFTNLQGVRMTIRSSPGGSTDAGGNSGSGATEPSDTGATTESSGLLIGCAVGVALSSLFLIWRLYMDFCHKERLNTTKLKRGDSDPSYTTSTRPEEKVVLEQSNEEDGVEISLAEGKPPTRSRSLDAMNKFMNRSNRKGSERDSRARSVSPFATRNSKLDGKDRLTRINRPNGRPRSAERDLKARNETLSTRSAHVPRSTERERDRVLMSKSAHQPRGGMDEEGAGKRWKEAKDARDAARMRARRPRSQDRILAAKDPNNPPGSESQRSCNSAGEPRTSNAFQDSEHSFAGDEGNSDLESESFLITDSPSKVNRCFSEPVPPAPPAPQAPTPTKSLDAKAHFKDDQMALYSPKDGSEPQIVQILQVQAFAGKKNIACYKIRLQDSNVEKSMVKETYLSELEEDAGVPSMASPSTRRKKAKGKPKSPKRRKKSKSPTRNNSAPMSMASPGKKRAKSKSPTRTNSATMADGKKKKKKKAKPGAIERSTSMEELKGTPKEGKQEGKRAVRRSSSWDGKSQNVSTGQQPLFKLPRRKKNDAKGGEAEDKSVAEASSDDSSWASFTKRPDTVKKNGSDAMEGDQQPVPASVAPKQTAYESSSEESDL